MRSKKHHLLVALTAHGYRHAAMTAPLVNELCRRVPGLAVTIQTSLDLKWLASRFDADFAQIDAPWDVGIHQTSATEIEFERTADFYRDLHARLDQLVAAEAARMRALEVDFVLTNVSYLSILAARQAGINVFAYSCLNWADVYGQLFVERPETATIVAEMRAGYAMATAFLRPLPAMPMEWLTKLKTVGPVARKGTAAPVRLRRLLGLAANDRIGIITFGGFDADRSIACWPRIPGWFWITTAGTAGRADMFDVVTVDMGVLDIINSCDAVVTKPGYNTFVESAVAGVPVLYVRRPDWPEEPYLVAWMEANARCLSLDAARFEEPGYVAERLQDVVARPPKAPIEPTGSREGAAVILQALGNLD